MNSTTRHQPSKLGSGTSVTLAKKLRRTGRRFVTLILLALAVRVVGFGQAQPTADTPRPRISRVSPDKVSPAVYVSIEGQWLRPDDESDAVVYFVQGGAEDKVESFGVGTLDGNPDGLQYTGARVPEGLTSGPCQVLVEVRGRRSDPFRIEIVAAVTPPVLTEVRPRWAQPGQSVAVVGAGFSGSDTVEITDASGRIREVDASKSAEMAYFPLPEDLPEGPASLKVVEHRSGDNRRSNSLGFVISRGPVPLHLLPEWLRPAGPGQSLYLAAATLKPLERATLLEVNLKQGVSSLTIPITNLKDLRVRIPRTMLPGEVEIRNRTWRGRVASEWSEPVPYKISDRPAAPLVYNIQIWPPDSEAAFIQGGKEVAVRPIMLDGHPRVKVPPHLAPGPVVVERRTRGGDRAGRKQLRSYSYHCCPLEGAGDGVLRLYALEEWIFTVPGRPRAVEASPGDVIVVEGDFFAQRADDLRVVLACSSGRSSLRPASVHSLQWISVRIPRPNGRGGNDCGLTVRNIISRTESTLPISLRIHER